MAQINKSSDYFNTVLYTGNGTTGHNITGVGFQPDWLWIKERSSTSAAFIYDIIRGVDIKLTPSTTDGDATNSDSMSSFDSDGFTVGVNNAVNENTQTYVAWNWLGANASSSNTDGSITSSVSANTTSGFSIVSYTGNGTAGATVGHGLGSAPKVVIVKQRTSAGYNWVYGSDLLTNWGYILKLNLTDAESSTTGTQSCFNSTAPTSSVFTVGTSAATNNNTDNFIAYCFAEKKGFSKFGSYTGNGSADGTFIYTGFRPAWVMFKESAGTSPNNWFMYDNKRSTFNTAQKTLRANTSDAETDISATAIDILSNGFKLRTNDTALNESGATYIYMAFAESPLVGTNNIPATGR